MVISPSNTTIGTRSTVATNTIPTKPIGDSRPAMDLGLEILAREVSNLSDCLGALHDRLEPAMRPAGPVETVEHPTTPSEGQYLDRLREQTRRITTLSEIVHRTIGRLSI